MIRKITKTVEYDEDEDVYSVKSFSNKGEKYYVNRLRDNNHWFCTCKGYAYSKKNPKTCKHVERIKVIDNLYKKYADKIEKLSAS
jgi:hypothetical protein